MPIDRVCLQSAVAAAQAVSFERGTVPKGLDRPDPASDLNRHMVVCGSEMSQAAL